MHEIQRGRNLFGHTLRVQFTNADVRNIRCQIAERSVFLCENIEAGSFERNIICGDNILVHAQMKTVMEFPVEIPQRDVWLWQSLQYHFGARGTMLHQ